MYHLSFTAPNKEALQELADKLIAIENILLKDDMRALIFDLDGTRYRDPAELHRSLDEPGVLP